MALMLKARGPAGEPAPFRLPARTVVVGRSPQADWILPDPMQQVSSQHATIAYEGDTHYLTDTSTNGTFVNGSRVSGRHILRAGDTLRIGPFELQVEEVPATRGAAMDLDRWSAPPPVRTATPPRPAVEAEQALQEALVRGLATLLATRARQRRELGVRTADPAGANPLALPAEEAMRALVASASPAAAVEAAVSAIETHHATVLAAVQEAFRSLYDRFAPDAIERGAGLSLPAGEARDAALWRAHVAAFAGETQSGFVEAFASAFRTAFEQRATQR